MDESLWGPLPRDKGCLSWRFGKTAIWVSDTEDEWEIASAPVDTDAGLSEETFPEDLTWTRYITTADDRVEVEPVLPDRPVVVRPASPIVILPGRWGRFFFRVPLWARFTSTGAGKRIPMTEVPSRRLASIWFGTIGSGELCYPIEAPLQRTVEQLEIDPSFATCEITVRNGSRERLQFERICVHVEYMRLYESGSRLWTNEVRVVFRGSEQVSQLTFLPGPPSSAKDATQVTDSRIPPESDLLKRSFALIREITGSSRRTRMSNLLQNIDIDAILAPEALRAFGFVLLRAVAALVVLRIVVMIVRRVLRRRTTKQVTMLATRAIGYVGFGIIVAVVLLEFGVNPGPLLGAAGIVGLAVGVASQASLSNMISGLFLVSEKPFSVGDVIRSADTTGIVESIDLLSVKIRTFDNLFIRIPNEKLANTTLVNITRYPIRRLDVKLVVPFETDLGELFDLLRAIAKDDPACLQEPEPLVVPDTFTEEGVRLLFGVWFAKSDFLSVKASVYRAVAERLREAGIRFAVPRREISARPGMWPEAEPPPGE